MFIKNMASPKVVNLMLVSLIFAYFSIVVFSATIERLFVPSPGPETSTFDSTGRGPYTGVTDGRIFRYNISTSAFDFFAVTAPNRPEALCNGRVTTILASTCGRPLGMAFYNVTNQLFVADAELGLFVVEPTGGQGILLANSANGTKFRLTDGLDVDQMTGNVYFTDASSTGGINEIALLVAIEDSTGRLLKYDASTKEVIVLLNGLAGPAGVAISQDGSYLLFTEFIKMRIQKYWLTGPKANTAEIILNVTGNPDNIKRTRSGEFWVGVTAIPVVLLQGLRIDGFGNILETLTFSPQFQSPSIADVQEYDDALLLGSLSGPYLGVYKR